MSELYTGLMVLAIFLVVATPMALLLRQAPVINPGQALRRAVTRQDAIRAAEEICCLNTIPFSDQSKLTACLGHGTYVLRSKSGKTVLISYPQAQNLVRASYGSTPGLQRLSLSQLDAMAEHIAPVARHQWKPDCT